MTTEVATPDSHVNGMFLSMLKVDEKRQLVFGRATAEVVDRTNEVADYEATKAAFQKWAEETLDMTGGKSQGNVREMHKKDSAVGVVKEIIYRDDERAIDVVTHIVDPVAFDKVLHGVYGGFSIGGGYAEKKRQPDGTTRYSPIIKELSLVDRPCCPDAKFFDVVKADGSVERREFAAVDAPEDAAEPLEKEVEEEEGEADDDEELVADADEDEDDGSAVAKSDPPILFGDLMKRKPMLFSDLMKRGPNPNARDGDGDGMVEDGTPYERPVGGGVSATQAAGAMAGLGALGVAGAVGATILSRGKTLRAARRAEMNARDGVISAKFRTAEARVPVNAADELKQKRADTKAYLKNLNSQLEEAEKKKVVAADAYRAAEESLEQLKTTSPGIDRQALAQRKKALLDSKAPPAERDAINAEIAEIDSKLTNKEAIQAELKIKDAEKALKEAKARLDEADKNFGAIRDKATDAQGDLESLPKKAPAGTAERKAALKDAEAAEAQALAAHEASKAKIGAAAGVRGATLGEQTIAGARRVLRLDRGDKMSDAAMKEVGEFVDQIAGPTIVGSNRKKMRNAAMDAYNAERQRRLNEIISAKDTDLDFADFISAHQAGMAGARGRAAGVKREIDPARSRPSGDEPSRSALSRVTSAVGSAAKTAYNSQAGQAVRQAGASAGKKVGDILGSTAAKTAAVAGVAAEVAAGGVVTNWLANHFGYSVQAARENPDGTTQIQLTRREGDKDVPAGYLEVDKAGNVYHSPTTREEGERLFGPRRQQQSGQSGGRPSDPTKITAPNVTALKEAVRQKLSAVETEVDQERAIASVDWSGIPRAERYRAIEGLPGSPPNFHSINTFRSWIEKRGDTVYQGPNGDAYRQADMVRAEAIWDKDKDTSKQRTAELKALIERLGKSDGLLFDDLYKGAPLLFNDLMKAEPRDADGDGMIYDGTDKERPMSGFANPTQMVGGAVGMAAGGYAGSRLGHRLSGRFESKMANVLGNVGGRVPEPPWRRSLGLGNEPIATAGRGVARRVPVLIGGVVAGLAGDYVGDRLARTASGDQHLEYRDIGLLGAVGGTAGAVLARMSMPAGIRGASRLGRWGAMIAGGSAGALVGELSGRQMDRRITQSDRRTVTRSGYGGERVSKSDPIPFSDLMKAEPRDGDGDGYIYDGTKRERRVSRPTEVRHQGGDRFLQGIALGAGGTAALMGGAGLTYLALRGKAPRAAAQVAEAVAEEAPKAAAKAQRRTGSVRRSLGMTPEQATLMDDLGRKVQAAQGKNGRGKKVRDLASAKERNDIVGEVMANRGTLAPEHIAKILGDLEIGKVTSAILPTTAKRKLTNILAGNEQFYDANPKLIDIDAFRIEHAPHLSAADRHEIATSFMENYGLRLSDDAAEALDSVIERTRRATPKAGTDDGIQIDAGMAAKHGARIKKVDLFSDLYKAGPRDGDGDGMIYDGTPEERPAGPAPSGEAPTKPKPTSHQAAMADDEAYRAQHTQVIEDWRGRHVYGELLGHHAGTALGVAGAVAGAAFPTKLVGVPAAGVGGFVAGAGADVFRAAKARAQGRQPPSWYQKVPGGWLKHALAGATIAGHGGVRGARKAMAEVAGNSVRGRRVNRAVNSTVGLLAGGLAGYHGAKEVYDWSGVGPALDAMNGGVRRVEKTDSPLLFNDLRKDGRAGRDGDGDGVVNEGVASREIGALSGFVGGAAGWVGASKGVDAFRKTGVGKKVFREPKPKTGLAAAPKASAEKLKANRRTQGKAILRSATPTRIRAGATRLGGSALRGTGGLAIKLGGAIGTGLLSEQVGSSIGQRIDHAAGLPATKQPGPNEQLGEMAGMIAVPVAGAIAGKRVGGLAGRLLGTVGGPFGSAIGGAVGSYAGSKIGGYIGSLYDEKPKRRGL